MKKYIVYIQNIKDTVYLLYTFTNPETKVVAEQEAQVPNQLGRLSTFTGGYC